MNIALQPEDTQPIYHQICTVLTEKIATGELKKGEKLLPEREMAECTGLSRGTITHAYKKLKAAGIISSRIGSGYYVSDPQEDETQKQAAGIVDSMFCALTKLKIPNPKILALINRKLIQLVRPKIKIRVALIECNNAGIGVLAKGLSHIPNIEFSSILLADIHSGLYDQDYFSGFDMLITTSSHYKELIEALPLYTARVDQVFFSLTRDSIIEFSAIQSGANIGVLCRNSRTNAVIKKTFDSFNIPYHSFDTCGDIPSEKIRDYIFQKDALIAEPFSRILDEDDNQRHVDTFVAQGGTLVRFHRNVDKGSVRHIEEILSKKIIDQCTALLTPNTRMLMGL
jgi:DNA-binding transcriptional regulator YhcF (GntR family)